MEDHLRDGGLDWTAVQPPLPTDKPQNRYLPDGVQAERSGRLLVSRADAAHFMLRVLQQQETVGHSIAIAY
jgi:hypothetical protein